MTTTPSSPREFEEYIGGLDSPQKFAAAVKDGSFKEHVSAYVEAGVQAKSKDMADISAQVREQAQLVMAEMLGDKKAAKNGPTPFDAPRQFTYNKVHNPRAKGAGLDGKFSDLGEFAASVWHKQQNGDLLAKRNEILNYQERVPSEGGFLVPEEFRAELLRVSLESSVVRPRARVVPMSSKTLTFPKVDSTTNATSVYGGVIIYRVEEGQDIPASDGSFGAVKLEATKQAALAVATNELVRDAAGGFAMYLQEILPEAIAFAEDLDFLTGTGVGEPLGALATGNTAIISVAKETSQDAATIVWQNVVRMYARMLPQSLNRAVWIVTPDALAELYTMGLVVGTGGGPTMIAPGAGNQAPPNTMLGRPIIVSEKAPATLGTIGDISFVDFGYYLIGDRQQMEMSSSDHRYFESDKTAFKIVQRNDGRPWLDSAITPANGGSTLSPFVQLATRS